MKQFVIFRIIFGTYLAWHFLELIPYANELFGKSGMIADPYLIPNWSHFPSPLHICEFDMRIYIASLTVISILFACGIQRRISALYILYGWSTLLNRNILISNPGIPYVGWLIFCCFLIPDNDVVPDIIFGSAWFLTTLGYTISGLHKLQCPSWIDGTALQYVLSGPLSRNNMITQFLIQNPSLIKITTWFSLFAEITFLPIGTFYHTRFLYWIIFLFIHIGILFTINFTDLTLGVLMIHFFIFEKRWIKLFRMPF